jgi:hypothetical protein
VRPEETKSPIRPLARESIVVTGMHRSGIAPLSAVLRAAGAQPGADNGECVPNASSDVATHFSAITAFNDSVLANMGWSWDSVPGDPPATDEVTSELVVRGRSVIERAIESPPRLVADPRCSVLMPLWRRVFADQLLVVVSVRPALDVAWSLAMRDGISVSVGLALWSAYYRHLVAGLSGLHVVCVPFDGLIKEPTVIAEQVLGFARTAGLALRWDAAGVASAIHSELRTTAVPPEARLQYDEPSISEMLPGYDGLAVADYPTFDLTARPASGYEIDLLEEHRRVRKAEADVSATRDELVNLAAHHAAVLAEESPQNRESVRAVVSRYEASTSWRITAPGRTVGRWGRDAFRRLVH